MGAQSVEDTRIIIEAQSKQPGMWRHSVTNWLLWALPGWLLTQVMHGYGCESTTCADNAGCVFQHKDHSGQRCTPARKERSAKRTYHGVFHTLQHTLVLLSDRQGSRVDLLVDGLSVSRLKDKEPLASLTHPVKTKTRRF